MSAMLVQMQDLKLDNMVLNPREKGKWLASEKTAKWLQV